MKSVQVLVRVKPDEHAQYVERTRADGHDSVASWLREAGRERLRQARPLARPLRRAEQAAQAAETARAMREFVVLLGDAVRALDAAINTVNHADVARGIAELASGYARIRQAALGQMNAQAKRHDAT